MAYAVLEDSHSARSQVKEFQHVRLSPAHPRVHLASSAITEEDKANHKVTYCGQHLGGNSLLNLKERVTCERCIAKLRARADRLRKLPR